MSASRAPVPFEVYEAGVYLHGTKADLAVGLPQADVLAMGHILHDWNLEEKKTLLAKAYEAVHDGGALIVFESIIDDTDAKTRSACS